MASDSRSSPDSAAKATITASDPALLVLSDTAATMSGLAVSEIWMFSPEADRLIFTSETRVGL
ncbi:unannotated protein [freshwater metagenome]|uniref:Unannotated protein n=1 Tax=freshwater metagenome TaxID=449393 RepID=A0A6J6DDN3_9ZZZZ